MTGITRGRPAARLLAIAILLVALLSDFLSPVPPDLLGLNQFFAPPSRIHFVDAQGNFHWRPFIYGTELVDLQEARYRQRSEQVYPLVLFSEGYPYRLFGLIPASRHLFGIGAAGSFHLWGTDSLGRDVWARTLAGARNSLLVLLLGLALYLVLGAAVGACAGLAGGWTDAVLMRFSEFVLALPALYLVLALRAILPPQMPFWQASFLTAATIASVTWPPMARGIRGLILQTRYACYVDAARAMGASPGHIFRRHMLPAVAPFALAQMVAAAPLFILGDVILSFLKMGYQSSSGSWGAMLQGLMQDPRVLTDFWWNMAPLGFVFLTLLCLNNFSRHPQAKAPSQLA